MTLVGRTGCPVFEECGISDFDSRVNLLSIERCPPNRRWLLDKFAGSPSTMYALAPC